MESAPNAYEAELLRGTGDQFVFGAETVSFHGGGYERPFEQVIGRGHDESVLLDVVGKSHRARALAGFVLEQVSGCRVYHFHDTSEKAPVKQYANGADNVTLQPDAGNLAPFLARMARRSPDAYRRILASVRQVAPFFDDLALEEEEYHDQIRLRWRQDDTVFPADALSDGTLRFLCLSTLLLQPDPPALIVLDEPELGLHPAALRQLADLLHAASKRTQVVIATQSVTLVDQFSLDDLIVVERQDGTSALQRPDRAALEDWLTEYSLGDLWQKSVLGGQPSFRER
ncbi:MAG: AAA family ATPase [Pseudonocardiaceae bacterium]